MPEHISVYGQTGSGKSYFERWILKERAKARESHIVILMTKPDDETVSGTGWPVVERWPPDYGKKQVIFWAKKPGAPGNPQGLVEQRKRVLSLLNALWVPKSNHILWFDELAYLCEDLGLRTVCTTYYREGRGLGITIGAGTQRPSGVVRQMHSEAGWKVAFSPEDEDDAKRMAEVMGNRRFYFDVLQSLDRSKYEFLITHRLSRRAYISAIGS